MPPGWPEAKLLDIEPSSDDVAPHQIGIHGFEIGGEEHPPRQDAVEKSRGEAFNLILNSCQHVQFGCVRNMAISPRNLLTCGSASLVKQGRLNQQHEGTLAIATLAHRRL